MGMALVLYAVMAVGATLGTIISLIGLIATFRKCEKNDSSLNWLIIILLGGIFAVSFYFVCTLLPEIPTIIELFKRGHA
ncbi:hypothetical protein Xmau_02011 [Xenorhabdus mauleonii]|uniref:Major facilitator superfamily (MFS) profile domain-containing protein n=1 Tax=Xenorhabdus mauleonii TaxID=351675 RepID=A0A1I3HVK0_9GAMM|nr:hypothetical protein [Xenorhabdus mauleonii]PHM40255.1 hypothetical protein Xmau_02011 [Xenorhabdus mauleonii]SFI39776.1 hypothetical protein SAMN05421680_10186 [Xenorhabdus mauleonii]